MRIYSDEKETELVSVICNCCEKKMLVENGIIKEECVGICHTFGYFSERDGEAQEFDLCEECYRKITGRFRIPANTRNVTEFL